MPFTFLKQRQFWWTVKILVPDRDDADKKIEQEFQVLFQQQDQKEQEAYAKVLSESETLDDTNGVNNAWYCRIVKDWRNINDEQGNPLPFSKDMLLYVLLTHPTSGPAIGRAYRQALSQEAAEKN